MVAITTFTIAKKKIVGILEIQKSYGEKRFI